ncbi:SGNH/GDSL hydrolase family protein [Acidobacteriota bacterium]
MKKIFLRGIIVILSVLFTFSILELGLRVVYKFRFSPRGEALLPIATTYQLSKNKQLLYELRPNSGARVMGIRFEINSSGFRDKKYSLRKDKKKRIIFVGDSITYGWNIELEETYHKILERTLDLKGYDVDAMGMGIVGYNTIQEYYLIKDKALKFNPDMIILQISPNDFERTVSIKRYKEGKELTLVPYNDFLIPYLVGQGAISRMLMKYSHFYKFINLKLYWLIKKRNKEFAPKEYFLLGEEASFQYLKKIKYLLDREGVQFSVVIFPFKKLEDIYPYESLHNKIHQQLEKMHVPYFDLYSAFNENGKEDIWEDRLHPNAKGNAIAGRYFSDFVEELIKE